ncbi:IS3 family transposase [Streptomyces noursei]|uniref:IS3 family transposase n=1 Tax=Streptomyces noursei TaxID=1971 RepID=UPI0022A7B4AB|nr:IS3 family transposase [Streptomyces noursei]MCZ1014817.1 IS3 family transposase [Streptomyces noursei]MCZ1017035.1 IS3 family transposase [Streptomyces noursei]MCZ1019853.1 IS3 family transposase [Streptomyces noursei]MCZ1021185.1 IS3 family transposase [Streptomyces noursei]MCZ1021278.1 IS3 family transposase [Streptomyces noursei]
MVMKVYSPEFKADAVALYLSDPSHTFEGIGKDLGISRETLRNWVRTERARRGQSGTMIKSTKDVPVSEATKEELEAEIAALRAENKDLRKQNTTLATERDILRKATKFFRHRDELVNRFTFIEDHHRAWGVKRLCHVLEVARSSFYKWRAGRQARAARERADAALAERIRAVHAEWDGTYGRPRITAELRGDGERVNHKRVGRVMRKYGIAGLRLRKRQVTTVPEPSATPVPDLLRRDFTASAPNTKYVGDITYLPVGDGESLYLATVIDCFSRRLVGWSIADHMRTSLIADALQAAAATRGSLAGAVFHSDHGAQYTSRQFAEICTELGVRQSMGAVGTSADNALAESFNAALKRETLRGARRFDGARACRLAVFRWTTRYNTRRRHSANRQQAPIAYEQQSATLTLTA